VVSINWGDGSTDASSVAISGPDASGKFSVTGSHKYADDGNYTITLVVRHDTAGNTTITSPVTVTDVPVVGTGVTLTGVEGSTANFTNRVIATFTDPGTPAGEVLGDYGIVSVNWGDGSTDASSVAISGPDANGVFSVLGGHTYAEEGNYTVTITINHDNAPATTLTSPALVSDP
jgi:hypothetical protein